MDIGDPIDTNRPSFMDSPLVVPRGAIQLENGTLFSGLRHGQCSYNVPETEFRVGLMRSTELQFFVPNTFLLHGNNQTDGKVGDLTEVGIKTHYGTKSGKYHLSGILGVTSPTGSPAVSGKGVQGVSRAPWSIAVNDKWSVAGMQSLLLVNQGKSLQWQPDFLLSRNVGSKASVFMEYGGFFTQRALPSNIAHFGGAYKITPHNQVDMQFGFGLNKAAPAAFVGVGYSYRFDKLAF